MASKINAPMVGKIVKILVEVGQDVAEDEPVMMLEAMKVEMPVSAPADGKIKSIRVKEGDTVESDQILVELE
ncbi:MAG: acetyl-CoA carboxylase biotin carboxyl carrier protein subunit [Myxococcota bacterium]|nr:acetyl-CoA carboxylase biotin carboxyl carrier protein subunit [Myxococcota bacterium]